MYTYMMKSDCANSCVQVWTMYAFMRKKLQQGYTSVLLRDGDFYYSFFLWFEDSMVSGPSWGNSGLSRRCHYGM